MTTQTKPRPWAEEELQLVAACWARGESLSDIAGRLTGRSRNAVLGIITRRGFKRGDVSALPASAPVRSVHRMDARTRRMAVTNYLEAHAAPITLAGPAWSHPSNARAA